MHDCRWSLPHINRPARTRFMADMTAKRRDYVIPSQRNISSLRADRLLRERGAVLDYANGNCMFAHSGRESTKHWIVKALLFKALRDLGRTVGTEVEVAGGIVDVLDADNLVAYEVETDIDRTAIERKCKRMWKMHDVVFVDASKVPDGLAEAERCVRGLVV